jgi:hypothetical protein
MKGGKHEKTDLLVLLAVLPVPPPVLGWQARNYLRQMPRLRV